MKHEINSPVRAGAAPTYRGCALIRLRSLAGRAQGWSTVLRDNQGMALRVLNESSKAKLIAAIDAQLDALEQQQTGGAE